jgi:hypothetical protein
VRFRARLAGFGAGKVVSLRVCVAPVIFIQKSTGILKNLTNYAALTQPLLEKRLKNRPRFSTIKKVTDHHAIIPTGIQ